MSAVIKELSNEPLCPCCGAPVSPLDLLVDDKNLTITYRGTTLRVPPGPHRLFQALLEGYPNVLTKEQCLNALVEEISPDGGPDPKIVDVRVCQLRKHLDPLGLVITTAWGVGYRLELSDAAKSEVLRRQRYHMTRRVKGSLQDGDVASIRMLRSKGFPLTDIARRLSMTFRTVSTAIDIIDEQERASRERSLGKPDQ